MRKIPSLFKREYKSTRLIFHEFSLGCEWVFNGEGWPTVKIDGTACLISDGVLYKRYDAKKGKQPPENWIPCEESPDPNTGHWPGWVPVGDGPEDQWHREAFDHCSKSDGTYELIGPKVQGNPYNLLCHHLVKHGQRIHDPIERTFEGIRAYLESSNIEGIVWYHPNGRMCKVKRKDFGFKWPV